MPTCVPLPGEIEPLVQCIEDMEPCEIVDHPLAKLWDGVPMRSLLTASALAVTRSSDLVPGHYGRLLHPLVGIHVVDHSPPGGVALEALVGTLRARP